MVPGKTLQKLLVITLVPSPGVNGAFGNGQLRVGNNELRVKFHGYTQSAALGTGAVRAVKGKHARRHLFKTEAAVNTGKIAAENPFFIFALNKHQPVSQIQRCLQRVGQAGFYTFTYNKTVDNDLDIVLLKFIQGNLFIQHAHFTVNAHPDIAFFTQFLKHGPIFSFAPPHQRRHNLQPPSLRISQELVDNLLDSLPRYGFAAVRAMGVADTRVQKTEIIIDFCYRAHRRTRIFGAALLIYGDSRGKPLNEIHVRFVHLPEELAGIGGEGFYIAPLAFGINCIKGQRRLPGAA